MAEPENTQIKYKMPFLTTEVKKALTAYGTNIIDFGKKFTNIRDRMDIIDEAYARYRFGEYKQRASGKTLPDDGLDRASKQACDITGKIVSPVVVSQVDTLVAYLADVFLSGYPIFPVASSYRDRSLAETIEAVFDDHSILDRYPRSLLLAIKDAVKYNMVAVETAWAPVFTSEITYDDTAVSIETSRKQKRDYQHINRIKRINLRNAVWDTTVLPCDISANGEFFGFHEKMTRIQLARHLQYLHNEGLTNKNLKAAALASPYAHELWNDDPIVNEYLEETQDDKDFNWEAFFADLTQDRATKIKLPCNSENLYIFTTLYVRIIPDDFGIAAPSKNTAQIWKLEFVNRDHLISARAIQSPNDKFPISVAQAVEDGLGIQTQSPAEQNIDLQETISTLMTGRISGTRRALGDRAIYDPLVIHPDDINNPSSTSKIPAKLSGMINRDIRTAYFQIPYDNRATADMVQDAVVLTQYSKELNGVNNATQGQFQKGNKSVQEFNTIVSNSENRMRLLALSLEMSLFIDIKTQLKYNLLSYGTDAQVTSPKTGRKLQVTMQEILQQGFQFEVADGYTPKSKIASVDMLSAGMNLLSQNQILAQSLGAMLPAMFIHLMSLGGVKGIEEYMPDQPAAAPQQQGPVQ